MTQHERELPGPCIGEKCSLCGEQAWHKVGEEIFADDPMPTRHNLTAYVCKEHFERIMDRTGFRRAALPALGEDETVEIMADAYWDGAQTDPDMGGIRAAYRALLPHLNGGK